MTSKDEPDFMAVAGIGNLSELESLYAASGEASIAKESDRLTDAYAAFIKLSPLVILATGTGERIDTSPRGDEPGFVRIVSDKLLALPDRRGNNRIDSLRNINVNPSLSLLFLIPGAGETVRVRGRGRITADENVRAAFAVNGKLPAPLPVSTTICPLASSTPSPCTSWSRSRSPLSPTARNMPSPSTWATSSLK